MNQSIKQFMWGFQPYFRLSLDGLATDALSAVGVQAAPEALLIGFRESGEDSWPICIEPENGPYSPETLEGVLSEAERLYEISPERDILISDKDSHERFIRELTESCRIKAISTALRGSDPESERLFFVGYPGIVGEYRVYPTVSVLRDRWNGYPQLSKEQFFHRTPTLPSLQQAVMKEVLSAATKALNQKEAPGAFSLTGDAPDVIRHATRDFVDRLVAAHGQWSGADFTQAMEAVAAQPYEGRTGVGTIILAKKGHPYVTAEVSFSVPVVLKDTRSFRKALEMTGVNLHLLSDGVEAYGLGRASSEYSREDETLYSVKVVGRGSWELSHDELPLLRLDYGIAKLPQERLSQDKFRDTVERVFGEAGDARALWDLTLAAAEQQHGTMLVVHRRAEEEATRLAPQALAIEPRRLEADALSSLTAIDGAILVAPDGRCHAVGVILDGKAVTGTGDASRGARYNSAVRYHHSTGEGECIIVTVSEDGMINLLPRLARRVDRSAVELAVLSLEDAAEGEVNFEEASKRDRHVSSLSFYLSAQQCDRVNAAREKVAEARARSGSMITLFDPKETPDPNMNESYFLPGT